MFASILVAFAAIAAAGLFRLTIRSGQIAKRRPAMDSNRTTPELDFPGADLGGNEIGWDRKRLGYDCKAGASVFGWPAKGGMYAHTASAVEVEFLGYERFKEVPRSSPTDPEAAADEESHCNKMRQLGAVWWESEYAWFKDQRAVRPKRITKKYIGTGWPAGGDVWVLSTTVDIAAGRNAGMLFNAYSMEERCKVIEQLGGTFYVNPKDCPDLDLA